VRFKSEEEWLANRKNYIGGSDAAAALGISPYKTVLQLCMEKWGESEHKAPTEAMERGKTLEPLVLEMYRARTGHDVSGSIENETWMSSEAYPFMAATPDGDDLDEDALLQIKTVWAWLRDEWGESGTQDIPDHIMAQVQHEMAVTEAHQNNVVALFGSDDAFRMLCLMLRSGMPMEKVLEFALAMDSDESASLDFCVYPIMRNDEAIEAIIQEEQRVWYKHVEAHEPPPDASIPEKTKLMVEADDDGRELLSGLKEIDDELQHWQTKYDIARAEVEKAIGENAGIFHDAIGKVTFKAPKAKAVVNAEAVVQELRNSDPEEAAALCAAHRTILDHDAVITDWRATSPDACKAAVAKHTTVTQGARRFLKRWNK
jgi:putative phage-type endonuclease